MTLYSKWSLGKNIMFIAGIVLLICTFMPWDTINLSDMSSGLSRYGSYRYSGADLEDILGAFGKGANHYSGAAMASVCNMFRFLVLVFLAYPVVCLFTRNYNKLMCCLSAVAIPVTIAILLVMGFRYFNVAAWLAFAASLAFFVGAVMAEPDYGRPQPAGGVSAGMPAEGNTPLATEVQDRPEGAGEAEAPVEQTQAEGAAPAEAAVPDTAPQLGEETVPPAEEVVTEVPVQPEQEAAAPAAEPAPAVDAPAAETVPQPELAPDAQPAFCIHCGSALVPGAKFCGSCGAKVE